MELTLIWNIIYILVIVLLVVLIIIGIKWISAIDKINHLLDDTLEKSRRLNQTFELIDTVSYKINNFGSSFTTWINNIINKFL